MLKSGILLVILPIFSHLISLIHLHRHARPRLARRRALGEHVKKAFAPSIVRSRLYDLVVRDDIIFYLELFQVTYDDLELVAVFTVSCSYASHDCHQTM